MSASNVSIRLYLRGLTAISLLLAAIAFTLGAIITLGMFGKSGQVGWYFSLFMIASMICCIIATLIYPELLD